MHKLSIIIILPTDRPEKILPTGRTTKHEVTFALYMTCKIYTIKNLKMPTFNESKFLKV